MLIITCQKSGQAEGEPRVAREALVLFIVVNVGQWFPETKPKR